MERIGLAWAGARGGQGEQKFLDQADEAGGCGRLARGEAALEGRGDLKWERLGVAGGWREARRYVFAEEKLVGTEAAFNERAGQEWTRPRRGRLNLRTVAGERFFLRVAERCVER